MQELEYFHYLANPMAQWLLNIQVAYLAGDGVALASKDPDAQAVLEAWWTDPVNNWPYKLEKKMRELAMYGEQCWPAFTAPGTGRVRLGYLDPCLIQDVILDPDNAEQPIGIVTKKSVGAYAMPERRYRVILPITEEELMPPAQRIRQEFDDGECFYFAINSVSNGSRGISDLLPKIDWLDGYEQFMFARVERAELMNRIIFDLELTGFTQEQIEAFKKAFALPPPGGIHVHNEKVKLEPKTPKLEAADAAVDARLFKHQALAGYPEHWYGGGGDVNRACHDMETETLTERGWRRYHEIADEDRIGTVHPVTGALEFHRPTRRYLYPYAGPMIRFLNKRVDLLVTPDHRMWAKRDRNDPSTESYEIIEAQKMVANRWTIVVGAAWTGQEMETFTLPEVGTGCNRAIYPAVTIPMDRWLEFLGYWISEGHARRVPGEYVVTLTQKKADGVRAIRDCLAALPFKFRESEDDRGCIRWVVNDKGLNRWLREQCGGHQPDRHLPDFIHALSARQLRIVFDAMILGDGSVDPRDGRTGRCYYTSSLRLADEMQVLALKLGMQAKIGPATRCYRVQINARAEASIGQDAIHYEDYRGEVYCFEVPNHLFVTRRNGKLAVTHNTAGEMDEPTFKLLKLRQRAWRAIITQAGQFALRQAKRAGALTQAASEQFAVVFPEMVKADLSKLGPVLTAVAQAVSTMLVQGLLTRVEARRLFASAAKSLGVELDELTEAQLADLAAKAGLDDAAQDYLSPAARRQAQEASSVAQAETLATIHELSQRLRALESARPADAAAEAQMASLTSQLQELRQAHTASVEFLTAEIRRPRIKRTTVERDARGLISAKQTTEVLADGA
jgi:hypothetical protein